MVVVLITRVPVLVIVCELITRVVPSLLRSRGRPKNTWRRSTEQDVKKKGLTWKQLERMAQDRRGWKRFINGLCSERNTKA